MIGNSWDKVLKEMFDSKEYQAFFQKIEKEYQNKIIYPKKENIYNTEYF